MKNFNINSIIEKKTSSNSIITEGVFCSSDVYGKFYINNLNDSSLNFSGVKYEQKIYKLIREKSLIKPAILDNVLKSIHDFENIYLYDFLDQKNIFKFSNLNEEIEKLINNISQINRRKIKFKSIIDQYKNITVYDNLLFNGFILNKVNMVSLFQYLKDKKFFKLKENEIIEIFFELIYSNLIYRNYLDIIHNDQHFGNIFIEELKDPIENYYYEFLGITKTKKYKIILFDNDHNYSAELGDNHLLDGRLCERYGSCNFYNNKDGYYILINYMIYFIDNQLTTLKFSDNNFFIKFYKNLCNNNTIELYNELSYYFVQKQLLIYFFQ